MKNLWIISLIVGLVVLLFFPEPETNFIYYLLTGAFFGVLTIVLFKGNKRKS